MVSAAFIVPLKRRGKLGVQGNINNVIRDLVTSTPARGFANSSSGDGANAVYGLSECRGDVSQEACSACITTATQQIRTTCPNSAESRIWYHQCFLRYENKNFFGRPNDSVVGSWYLVKKWSDEQAFSRMKDELMGALAVVTISGENRKFAWGKIESHNINNTNGVTLYGMVQCTWDLQEPECLKCLKDTLNTETIRCSNHAGCFVIATSCSFRYEIYQYLFLDAPLGATVPTNSITIGSL